jgi:signal transduction histidine kinase/CheY-like chemotaxis protein
VIPRAEDTPNATDKRVQMQLNAELYMMGRNTQLAAFLTAMLTWNIFYWQTGETLALVWAGLMHGVQGLRALSFHAITKRFPTRDTPKELSARDIRSMVPLLAVASTAWGLSSWLLTPPGETLGLQAVLMVILFGMLAASLPAISQRRSAVLWWLGPLSVLLIARFALEGDSQGWLLSLCTVLYSATLMRYGFVQNKLLTTTLRGQIERQELTNELMLRTRELQRLNRERSRFFASASHDLRQPVHALALFSRSLLRDLEGHSARPVAERVVQSTDAVSGLLNAMLDISRIDAGTVVPRPSEVAVDEVFLRVAQLFEPRAQEVGLALRFHTPPTVMHIDSELLLRILANFVDNAIKYTSRGGVLVGARVRGDRMRLSVWDTGQGILDEHIAHVFDEFYQVDNPQRDVARGLGIGLSIVRRLAHLLGGEVGVRSRLGHGSVFWLDVPRRAPMQPASALPELSLSLPVADPSAPVAPPRVLVLDDEAQVGEAVRLWLAPHCARVEVTTRSDQAVALLQAEPDGFDALVVDYRLAGPLNGIEAAAELWRLAGRSLPTILVTGDTDPDRVRAAYASGLTVMFKPVQPEVLLQTLRELIRSDVGRPA